LGDAWSKGVTSLFEVRCLIIALVAGLTLCLVADSGAVGTQNVAKAVTVCPGFSGPAWVFATKKGTKYSLETFGGYKCSTATAWVKKLAAKTLPSAKQNTHYPTTGPVGFTCEASPDTKRHAFTGSCEKLLKAGAEKAGFDWTSSFF
jgi:hypothetical protein